MYGLVKAHDYDASLGGSHTQVMANLGGRLMEVDTKLKDMLERLNGTSLGMITTTSCQYDFGGFSSISFQPQGLLSLISSIIRKKHIEKYGTGSTYAEESLYSAIAHKNAFIYYEKIGCCEKSEDIRCRDKPYYLTSQSICAFKTQLFETKCLG